MSIELEAADLARHPLEQRQQHHFTHTLLVAREVMGVGRELARQTAHQQDGDFRDYERATSKR